MKKSLVVITLLLVMTLSVLLVGCSANSIENMIGTTISLKMQGIGSKRAERLIHDMVREVEKSVSTNMENSTISRINRSKIGETIELDDTTNLLIEHTYKYYLLSEGSFDISIFPLVDAWKFSPGKVSNIAKEPPTDEEIALAQAKVGFDRAFEYNKDKKTITKKIEGAMLDLGAVAKGYIADKANEIVMNESVDKAIIDIGGTIYLHGDKPFKVGIKHPRPKDDYIIKILELENTAISTSGDYERYYMDKNTGKRYHHIIDPKTGRPADNGIVSVTIVSDSGMLADILSTTVFVVGKEKGIELLKGIEEVSSAIIMTEENGEIVISEYKK